MPARLAICSHCILSICNSFGIKSGICFLFAPVPVHCFSINSIPYIRGRTCFFYSVRNNFIIHIIQSEGVVVVLGFCVPPTVKAIRKRTSV